MSQFRRKCLGTVTLNYKKRNKYINTTFRQDVELLNVKRGGK
jgi:hypothetical protein